MSKRKQSRTSSRASRPSKPEQATSLDWNDPEQFNCLPAYDAVKTAEGSVWCGAAALHAVRFIESLCRFSEGEWMGKPFVLQPWQRAFVANLYGWMRPDGTRRYRQAHLLVPRKSGKTEMAAALCLLHLLADDEETPEVVSIARDREQAKLCFKRARRMAEQEPQIKERIEVYQNRLVAPDSHGVYKTLSSDAPGAHGLSVSACIADEIHAMEDRRELWEAVMTSMGARRQPLIISITTSGVLRQSLEFDMFTYAQKVCQRVIDNPAFLPCLYYADTDADWLSPETWKKANPSLGSTVRQEWYEAEAKRAQDQPSYETPFRTYYLCQHVTAADRWIRMSDWDACAAEIDENALKTLPCYLGIDLGQTQDLSSIAAVWLDGDRMIVKNWNYAPEVGAAIRARRDGVPYLDWSQRGFLTLTEGDTTDYRYLLEQVERIAKENRVRLIGYDPYNAQNLANDLEHRGHKVVRVPQSYLNMSTPTRMFERAITGKTLQHDGGPVLSWAMSNACTETDFAGNPRVSKRRSVERVDPVIATIVALAASLHDEKLSNSIYEKRGLVWL